MSETYTIGADAFATLKDNYWSGQTFRVRRQHVLHWVDLGLRIWGTIPVPFVGVYLANAQHEPWGDCLSRNRYWLLDVSFATRDWLWFEPWGKTVNENHYWILQPVISPPIVTILNGRITIENIGVTANWISTLVSTIPFPLVDPDGKHLYFHHHAPLSEGHPQHHWHSYTFITNKALTAWYLEATISHGTDWPPFNGGYHATPLGAAFFEGKGPNIFDFTQHWINARTALGLDPDPTGWTLSHVQLRVEDTIATPGGRLTNAYLGIANQRFEPPPLDDYPIGPSGFTWPWTPYRVRFSMQPLLLTPDNYYALIATASVPFLAFPVDWQYDKDDATYPRGIRISSIDSRATWTKHYNDDHIFAEFGTPPAPTPPPEPPVPFTSILDIEYTHTPTGLIITLPTSVPCHLTCYWTDKKPLKHAISRTVRGLTVPWSTYFCFVGWHPVEQDEPGDTLYHTFDLSPWPICETRWFTFRGNIANELSPSVGPIFEKHKAPIHYGPFRLFEYYNIDNDTWATCHIARAQTFTPQINHKITSVKLLNKGHIGSPPDLTVFITRTSLAKPPVYHYDTMPYIAKGVIDCSSWLPDTWYEVPMNILEGHLAANTMYAIVPVHEIVDPWNTARIWADRTSPTYTRGVAYYWDGSEWLPAWLGVNSDWMFEEWGYPFD